MTTGRWWRARRGLLAGVALLVAWGAAKQPWEERMQRQNEAVISGQVRMNRTMRDQMTQGTALALLSGFRRVVANFLWIRAHGQWERKEWFRMRNLLELVCTLQPRSVYFWDSSSWHMAWNISVDAYLDPTEPREAQRLANQREWIDAGRKLLERGLENVPDKWDLWFKLGWLYDQKYKDYLKAAEYFRKASEFPDAPLYVTRMVGYDLEKGGRPREAYDFWVKLWRDHPDKDATPLMLWDRVRQEIARLEKELSIPASERLFPEQPPSG